MELWRIILLIAIIAAVIPNVRVMNQVKALEERGARSKKGREELAYKKKQMKFLQRILIAIFLIALAAVLVKVYVPLIQHNLSF